jgi:hypothetical protein
MFMADGGGGGTDLQQSIFDSMNNFANLAAAGDIEVSAEGGQALINAINGFQDWAKLQTRKIDHLTQTRKLGTSNGAQVMAAFMPQVAADGQGFDTQLKALIESLEKAKEGINKAMANYQATESGNKAKFDTKLA